MNSARENLKPQSANEGRGYGWLRTSVADALGLALCFGAGAAMIATAEEKAAQSSARVSVESRLLHLRSGEEREWSSFPEMPNGSFLEARFTASANSAEVALRLRQQDVKQRWHVKLNDKRIGELVGDEADMIVYVPIAAGALLDGENVLRIECAASTSKASDDIRVGELWIEKRTRGESLEEASLQIDVIDADAKEPLPSRITIVDADGSLQSTAAQSNDTLAVRPGVIYTSTGSASLKLPAGRYTVYAGRGFEYSLAQVDVKLAPGEAAKHTLAIRRELPTPGYIACDTHIHTFTFSRHGDATLTERLITIPGEGIELPIATDHNLHVDYRREAERLNVRRHFTPVMGNEVTTKLGHFNIFPVTPGARVPDFTKENWSDIFAEIFATPDVDVAILNHARDVHSGVRPFGPQLFNAAIGENVAGWPMKFNAMEVINSGATQTDTLRLFHDWMAVLNRGYQVTPVGSSDSHDVSRYIVGQGRTYIRCDDRDPGDINVEAAVENFLAGKVLVSYGLLTELWVNGEYQSGDLAPRKDDQAEAWIRVKGPAWTSATKVQLYANGELVREEQIPDMRATPYPSGLKWEGVWKLPPFKHDVHLVAIAIGPGVDGPYWATAKPYQPLSPDWEPHVFGFSGAVWLDGDGDGKRSTAKDYAERVFAATGGDLRKLTAALATYDAATAAQAAHLHRTTGGSLLSDEFSAALKTAAPAVREGFRSYVNAWREESRSQQ